MNPMRLISSEKMVELIRYCEDRFDYIILDTPSIDTGAEAGLLKKYVNGYVMVVKAKNSDIDSLGRAINSLKVFGATVYGFVLTGEPVKRERKRRKLFHRR